MEKQKVLLTGGLGYIGSHIVIELVNMGYEVDIIDNLYNSSIKCLEALESYLKVKLNFFQIDICNFQALEDQVFSKYNYSAIIHLAAVKSVGESVSNPIKYYKINVVGGINLIELCLKYKLNNFIFSSSACVYGNTNEKNTEDRASLSPINPYGQTKLMFEKILSDTANSNPEFKVVNLRYFNPVGAHPSGVIGESPTTPGANLFGVIESLIRGKKSKMTIFGNDYNTTDGTAIRDYVHVVDIAFGHVKALEVFKDSNKFSNFEIFNMGTQNGNSVLNVINTYMKVNKVKIEFDYGKRREGDAECVIADCQKIFKELGWKSEKGLEEMCRDSYNWVLNCPEGF